MTRDEKTKNIETNNDNERICGNLAEVYTIFKSLFKTGAMTIDMHDFTSKDIPELIYSALANLNKQFRENSLYYKRFSDDEVILIGATGLKNYKEGKKIKID